VHLRAGWGDRDVAVASVADLHDRYDLSRAGCGWTCVSSS